MPNAGRIRVAVVGAGWFGSRRAMVAATNPSSEVRVLVDAIAERARKVASGIGCAYTTDWEEVVVREDIDVVIVSTPTSFLPVVAQSALEAGKHVLCEKPFGPGANEVLPAVEAARRKHLRLKVGYNHRYHPAIEKAYRLFQEGAIGRVQFLRCRYGHGGRPDYDQDWRAQADSGGGQLLDQGVHALDLFRWFLGDFHEVTGFLSTVFWPIAPLEDNVFALLRTEDGRVASLHASWTNWKNIFSFEVFGERGYLSVEGLGGNYGLERLLLGVRHTLGANPKEQLWEFPEEDSSLQHEWEDFLQCIRDGREPASNGQESWQTLKLVAAIYRAAREGNTVRVETYGDATVGNQQTEVVRE